MHVHMNVGQFLVSLGIAPLPLRPGLACPAYIADKARPSNVDWGMIETKEEVAAQVDSNMNLAEHVCPGRSIGAKEV